MRERICLRNKELNVIAKESFRLQIDKIEMTTGERYLMKCTMLRLCDFTEITRFVEPAMCGCVYLSLQKSR